MISKPRKAIDAQRNRSQENVANAKPHLLYLIDTALRLNGHPPAAPVRISKLLVSRVVSHIRPAPSKSVTFCFFCSVQAELSWRTNVLMSYRFVPVNAWRLTVPTGSS